MRHVLTLLFLSLAAPAFAWPDGAAFDNIDGGTHQPADWAGRPVLLVNTASLCAFTPQYAELQDLWERYEDRGLIVLAVPSDDFAQELEGEAEVKDFCEVNYGLTLPMTAITHVRREPVHPVYRWLAEEAGFVPAWNFNKVLIDGEGEVVATWGSATPPMSDAITNRVEALLPAR